MADRRTYGSNYERTKDLNKGPELKKEIAATIKKDLAKGGSLYEILTRQDWTEPPQALGLVARPRGAPLTPAQVKAIKVTLKETGGRTCYSTRATIRGFPGILNPERVGYDLNAHGVWDKTPNREADRDMPRLSPRASAFKKALHDLIQSFNYDGSDSMTDYFDVRFYLDVNFDHEDEQAERDAIIKKCSPKRAARKEYLDTLLAVVADWCADRGVKRPPTWIVSGGEFSGDGTATNRDFMRYFAEMNGGNKVNPEDPEADPPGLAAQKTLTHFLATTAKDIRENDDWKAEGHEVEAQKKGEPNGTAYQGWSASP